MQAEIEFLEGLRRYCLIARRGPRVDIAAPALQWEQRISRELDKLKTKSEGKALPREQKELVAA